MTISKASFVLVIFSLSVLLFVPSNATMSLAEKYWKTKVGNIPMPKALKLSLPLGSSDNGIEKIGPNNEPYYYFLNDNMHLTYTHVDQSAWPIFITWATVVQYKCEKPKDGRVLVFTYDTLSKVGTKMKLYFPKKYQEARFLPSHIAKSLPTTYNKVQEILNILHVKPKTILARNIEMIMKECEGKGVEDQKRYCAMSVEGMVDHVTSGLNSRKNKLMAVSTEPDSGIVVEYTIQKVRKLGSDDNHNIVCHKMGNPYAIYLCHNIKSTDIYRVSLVDVHGKQLKAIAMCHKDTSSFNPKHYAFESLNIKPGGKPICHFAGMDAIVWFRN